MGNMIVSENQIKSRMYNLVIDGDIVEEYLSPRMANILRNEYREQGFAVDKIEIFSVTKGLEIVGENAVTNRDEVATRSIGTPAATANKIKNDRMNMAAKNAAILSRKNKNNVRYYVGTGRERNSLLHNDYLNGIRKNGYRVVNLSTGEVWIGFQSEIVERIFNYLNRGGDKANLDIKFIGK